MSDFLPIENYVPHRNTMLLLDRLLEASDEHVVAELRVPRDGPFIEEGTVPSWIAIEYMAQAIAAWAGYHAVQKHQPIKIGFLLGTRKFEAFQPCLQPDSVLRVEALCELRADNGLGMFSCCVWDGRTIVAQAQISVFEPEDGAAFVQASAAIRENTND